MWRAWRTKLTVSAPPLQRNNLIQGLLNISTTWLVKRLTLFNIIGDCWTILRQLSPLKCLPKMTTLFALWMRFPKMLGHLRHLTRYYLSVICVSVYFNWLVHQQTQKSTRQIAENLQQNAQDITQTIQQSTTFGFWSYFLFVQAIFLFGYIWWRKHREDANKKLI